MLAAATVHFPYMTASPDGAPEAEREATVAGFHAIGRAIAEARVDTLVALTSEHIVNLQPRLVAPFVIGIAGAHRSFPEPHFNLDQARRPGDTDLALDLLDALNASGFDPAYSNDLLLDHGTNVPLQMMGLDSSVAIVPIVINSLFKPMPSLERCWQFGRAIRAALDSRSGSRRVGLLATGGISHVVGADGVDRNDHAFDTRFLKACAEGDHDRITAITEAEIDAAGNGTHEIRNWVALTAAMAPNRPRVLTALPYVSGWNAGVHQFLWDAK